MEADYRWSHVKHQLKLLITKTRDRIAWLWHGSEAELVIVGSKARSHATCHFCIDARSRMREKIKAERAVGGSNYLLGLVPRSLRRQRPAAERAERARV
jgi:hypothetical protein